MVRRIGLFLVGLLFPALAFAGYNVTNTSTITWSNNTTNIQAAVSSVPTTLLSGTIPASSITGLLVYTNESTTVSNTSTINLTLSGTQISATFNNSAGYINSATNPTGSGAALNTLNASNLTGQVPAGAIPSTSVSPGTYGSTTIVPQIAVGADGRVTSVVNQTISNAAGNLAWTDGGVLKIFNSNQTAKVGIGTTAPSEMLDVVGNAKISGTMTVNVLAIGNGTASGNWNIGTDPWMISGTSVTGILAIRQTGNVGIGTTVPNAMLQVVGTINATGMNIGNNAVLTTASNLNASLINAGTIPGTSLPLQSNVSAGAVSSSAGQNAQVWKTDANGVPAWRADATGGAGSSQWLNSTQNANNIYFTLGNIGVGTTDPSYKLSVVGNNTGGGNDLIAQLLMPDLGVGNTTSIILGRAFPANNEWANIQFDSSGVGSTMNAFELGFGGGSIKINAQGKFGIWSSINATGNNTHAVCWKNDGDFRVLGWCANATNATGQCNCQ